MSFKERKASNLRVILAGLVGNVIEWYDFALYGYFATTIGQQFFPSDKPSVSLIAAFGAFAAGFIVRPLGGLFFGRIGDLISRKDALILTLFSMAVPTILMACMPNYNTIGIAAPILIVILRIIQGLSVGGEYTTSIVYLVENAPKQRRAFFAIWGLWGAVLGILLASAIASILANNLDQQQLNMWGWRVPFALGTVVAAVGLIIRRSLDSDVAIEDISNPIKQVFGEYRNSVFRLFLLNIGSGVGFYAAFVYVVSYVKEIGQLPERLALNLNTAAMAILLMIYPLTAWLSDRIGRKPLLITGGLMLMIGAIPFFHLIHSVDPITIFCGQLGFVIALATLSGGLNVANVELMPKAIRCTGLAFAYNTSIGIFGGTTPLIATLLIEESANPISPAYWVAGTSAITLLTSIFWIKETRFSSLS
jgi:MHS family proline/betaine transporter-like MFS transporter